MTVIGKTTETEIEQETPTVIEQSAPADRDYQLLVPIANPDHTEQLMRTARDIAADNGGEILVLSVVDLPEQTPLSAGQKETEDRQEILERAMDVEAGGGADVPVHGVVRIGHHVDEAILQTITQHDSDAVLMGWHGRQTRRRDVVLGSIVDTVIQEAACDVLVEGEDVTETIVDESAAYDLTVIGATREGLLQKLVFGTIPEQVGQETSGAVIMAKTEPRDHLVSPQVAPVSCRSG